MAGYGKRTTYKKRVGKFARRAARTAIGGRYSLIGRRMYPNKAPTRFGASRKTYSRNLVAMRLIKGISETKYLQLTPLDNEVPTVQAMVGGNIGYRVITFGGTLPVPASIVPLGNLSVGGASIAQGVTAQQRVGEYAFLDHMTSLISIQMDTNESNVALTEFRVLMVQPKQRYSPVGYLASLNEDLLLDQQNDRYGFNQFSLKNPWDAMTGLVNKRRFRVLRQTRFTLSAADAANSTAYSGKYPCKKDMRFKMPIRQKAKFDGINTEPNNVNTNFFLIVMARQVGAQLETWQPVDWSISLRGTSTFKDV